MATPEKPEFKDRLEELSYGKINVKKIGGSAIEDLESVLSDLESAKDLGQQRIAVSAIRSSKEEYEDYKYPGVEQRRDGFNTTDHLKYVAKSVGEGNFQKAKDIVKESIIPFMDKIVSDNVKDSALRKQITSITSKKWGNYLEWIESLKTISGKVEKYEDDWLYEDGRGNSKSFLQIGEDISAEILHEVLSSRGMGSHLLLLDDAIQKTLSRVNMKEVVEDKSRRMQIADLVEDGLYKTLQQNSEADIMITSGYQPGIAVKGGYTDTTAAILARMVLREDGEEALFHRHMDGPFGSGNPGRIKNITPIEHCSTEMLFEATGESGPQSPVLEPDAARILNDAKCDLAIYNPAKPDSVSHIESGREWEVGQARFVDSIKAKTVVRVKGDLRIMDNNGVINSISSVCDEIGLSVVHVATTAKSLSMVFDKNLSDTEMEKLESGIRKKFDYDTDLKFQTEEKPNNCHLLFCKGDNMSQPGIMHQITYALTKADANIKFASQAGDAVSMVFIVETDNIDKVLNEVHDCAVLHEPGLKFMRNVVARDIVNGVFGAINLQDLKKDS